MRNRKDKYNPYYGHVGKTQEQLYRNYRKAHSEDMGYVILLYIGIGIILLFAAL